MDHSERLSFLFDRYLSGACSPREVEELVLLLREEGADDSLKGRMRELWDQQGSGPDRDQVNWDGMLDKIKGAEENLDMLSSGAASARLWRWSLAAAAVVAVITASTWWITRTNIAAPTFTQAPAMAAKVTAPAKINTVHLPDGSTVVLNGSSKLDFPTAFTGNTREVTLSGEGYFDIKPAPGRPFLVHTGKLTTRVLGTTFNIKAYPGDKAIEVTVTSGRVQVLKEEQELGTLAVNQQIRFEAGTEAVRQQTVNIQPVIAWKPEDILFDNMRFEDVARSLERRFGVKVSFASAAIKDCRVTATFAPDDSLEEILSVVCAVTQNSYTLKDGSVTLSGQGCS